MLNIDRYHATMGEASLKDATRLRSGALAEAAATFYVTQRKLKFAPCLGHERLVEMPDEPPTDEARQTFLREERGALAGFADLVGNETFAGEVRAVRPGTIIFANEPFADVSGAFALTQAQEIKFEHAFDLPMTTASLAMQFRMAAGKDRYLSDFSLRRCGDIERAVDVARYAYTGGFDDTSNIEAAFELKIPAVGTCAHYWQQAYIEFLDEPEIDSRTDQPKHFEQVAFERWLDANPQGTILLLDTIDVAMGARHALLAATSSEARRKAFKGFRVDSGDLAERGRWCLEFFESNGLHDLMAVLTGDLDVARVKQIVTEFPAVRGFGVGTKLSGEVARVAGVIFKLSEIAGHPTMKLSDTLEKSTLPGRLQIFRGSDAHGNYVGDVIGLEGETEIEIDGATEKQSLLLPFQWKSAGAALVPPVEELRRFVREQAARFRDIENYPVNLSVKLRNLRERLAARMRA